MMKTKYLSLLRALPEEQRALHLEAAEQFLCALVILNGSATADTEAQAERFQIRRATVDGKAH